MNHRDTAQEETPHIGKNAPNTNAALSRLVDVAQATIDEARAAGLHGIADELDSVRARVATIALNLWRLKGEWR
jgi:hypothetical protein